MARKKIETSESMRVADNSPVQLPEEPKIEVVEDLSAQAPTAPLEPPPPLDDGVAELKKRLEASEEARQRAERERNEAVQRAYKADNEKADSDLLAIQGSLERVNEQAKFLKREFSAAMAAQDYDRVAEIQEALSLNKAQALQLQNGVQSLKERPKGAPRPLDPVEAFASQLSPKSAAWVRAHPEYVTNPRLNQKMIAAHQLALADGLQADTEDYFSSVEDTLKIAPTRAKVDAEEEAESPFSGASDGRQRQSPAIPVSRNISPSGQSTKRTYRLSVAEVEAAKEMGLTPEEYARNRAEVANDPRYRSLYN